MSVIGSNVLAGASGQGGGYNLTNSLRFRSSASAYLNRTPASAGNRKTWTWSAWIKRGALTGDNYLFAAGTSNSDRLGIAIPESLGIVGTNGGSNVLILTSTPVYRDPSAWYHVVVAIDTTQATSSDRAKVYVNGVQVTAFSTATYPSQNTDLQVNSTNPHVLGTRGTYSVADNFDGYMAEVNFIDGQALTPSSFGETSSSTGVWIPKKYTGTYGTNGFYLPFTDNSALTTSSNVGLGKDFSGNANYWTTNNISLTAGSTYDSMTDVPTLTSATAANYCVFNPLNKSTVGTATASGGNLNIFLDRSSDNPWMQTTFALPTSGKWYFEFVQTAADTTSVAWIQIGVMDITTAQQTSVTSVTGQRAYRMGNGNKISGTSSTSYGNAFALNDILGVAIDMDSGKMWFAKNNTWQVSGDPVAGTNATFTDLSGTTWSVYAGLAGQTTANGSINFGQQPFAYTPPTGFVALNTFNLPTPTIGATASTTANKYFDATTYTGNGTSGRVLGNSGGFQADLVWIKGRSVAWNHQLADIIRGGGKSLQSNLTDAEVTNEQYGYVSAFSSSGFTLTTGSLGADLVNNNTSPYVAWQWKANGTGVTNTAGSITSTVSANTTSGFSIVTYTGTGANATVGHGLGVAPSMYIVKRRNAGGDNWAVYHVSTGNTQFLRLDTTNAAQTFNLWQNTTPTSSVFYLTSDVGVNGSGSTYVAYCFAQVAGYSAFGSYTGNGSTDGVFVYTGFRPKYWLIKRTDSADYWVTDNSVTSPYNPATKYLLPSTSDAEGDTGSNTAGQLMDVLSNGFKLRNTNSGRNASGGTYIYMAFAENPFKYANAR
jgi:hypothetical protein